MASWQTFTELSLNFHRCYVDSKNTYKMFHCHIFVRQKNYLHSLDFLREIKVHAGIPRIQVQYFESLKSSLSTQSFPRHAKCEFRLIRLLVVLRKKRKTRAPMSVELCGAFRPIKTLETSKISVLRAYTAADLFLPSRDFPFLRVHSILLLYRQGSLL